MFAAQEKLLDLTVEPKKLTTREMFVPTCATCHMSGINGLGVTHDPSERLSYFLANAISEKRPNYADAQAKMQQVCSQCHTASVISRVYEQAEKVVTTTNENVSEAKALMDSLRGEGLIKQRPSLSRLILSILTSGIMTDAPPNTPIHGRRYFVHGMATIRCCERRSTLKPWQPI